MLDLIQNAIQNWAGNIPNGGGSVFTSTSSNGFGTDVIIKNGLDQVTQTFQGLDLSQANDIIRQLLGF